MQHIQRNRLLGRTENVCVVCRAQPFRQIALEVECEQRDAAEAAHGLQYMNGGSGLSRPHAAHDRHVGAAAGAVEREFNVLVGPDIPGHFTDREAHRRPGRPRR